MIAALKFLHIAGLLCWCAALIALPLFMQAHAAVSGQQRYARYRLVTHLGYIAMATPAALVTIIAGTALIFAAEVFTPWLLLKLACVCAMVVVHAWLGQLIQRSGEERRSQWRSAPMLCVVLILPLIAAVLALVLAKPDLGPLRDLLPAQLLSPRGAAS